jgi:bifunctional ADP-heptose synthase (sugar kinase/adenylyltransferase)
MNAAELTALAGAKDPLSLEQVKDAAAKLAGASGRPVFVTLAERGIIGAAPGVVARHESSLPLRGPIDVVGAGDAVTANLTAALAAGADVGESLQLAMSAASLVIHQLGTTGTASVEQMAGLLPLAQ